MKRLAIGCFVLLVACNAPRLTVVLNRIFQGDHDGVVTCGIVPSARPNEVCLTMSGLADCTTSGVLDVTVIDPPESKGDNQRLEVTLGLSRAPKPFDGPCFPKPRRAQAVVFVRVETRCLNNPDEIGITTSCRMP